MRSEPEIPWIHPWGSVNQPLARRIGNINDGAAIVAGLVTGAAGFAVGAVVAVVHAVFLVPVASILLGAGYGMLLVSGLHEVESLAARHELASLAAVYYSLTYIGFGAPYLLALLAPRFGYPICLVATSTIMLVTVIPVLRTLRANPVQPSRPDAPPVPVVSNALEV